MISVRQAAFSAFAKQSRYDISLLIKGGRKKKVIADERSFRISTQTNKTCDKHYNHETTLDTATYTNPSAAKRPASNPLSSVSIFHDIKQKYASVVGVGCVFYRTISSEHLLPESSVPAASEVWSDGSSSRE